jgi:hypothetical protein
MRVTFSTEERRELLQELTHALTGVTIQTLRGAAKYWGWPLRGTAKADLAAQLIGYLGDAGRMSAAIQTQRADDREALGWLVGMGHSRDAARELSLVMSHGSGRQLSQKAANALLQRLGERCLVFTDEYDTVHVPALYLEWLPYVEGSRLLYGGEPRPLAPLTLAELNQHVDHLLAAVEADRPVVVAPAPSATPYYASASRAGETIVARRGLVALEMLARWGYTTPGDRHLACFLLEVLLGSGLFQVTAQGADRRLTLVAQTLAAWQELTPLERLQHLRLQWFSAPQHAAPVVSAWDELDLMLPTVSAYSLRQTYAWATQEQLHWQIANLRTWLVGLLGTLRRDTWQSVEQLINLVYHLRRDPFQMDTGLPGWRWYRASAHVEPSQMTFEVWRETYGHLIEAWLVGPASWLALVEIGQAGDRPAAFRVRGHVPAGETAALPPDALRFPATETAVLRNGWQTAELRQLLRRVAAETARSRETTTFTLAPDAFRGSLAAGLSAEAITGDFAATGFPLPAATVARLRDWQGKAGRHQIYDNLAVIECGEDMHPSEVSTIVALAAGALYPVAPRCLVALNPEAVPALVDDLRRRGYTPQVLP